MENKQKDCYARVGMYRAPPGARPGAYRQAPGGRVFAQGSLPKGLSQAQSKGMSAHIPIGPPFAERGQCNIGWQSWAETSATHSLYVDMDMECHLSG